MLIEELSSPKYSNDHYLLQFLEATFNNTDNGIILTDENLKIIAINQAFTLITGYSYNDIKDQTPRILKSGKHDLSHYKKMWQEITRFGFWQGVMVNKNKAGEQYTEWLTIKAIKDKEGNIFRYIGIMYNLSLFEEKQKTINFLKSCDSATSLLNRSAIVDYLAGLDKETKQQLFLSVIDIDHFYFINERYGTATGDLALKEIAKNLNRLTLPNEKLARISADKFLLVGQFEDQHKLALRLASLKNKVSKNYFINSHSIDINLSLGIELGKNELTDVSTLLRNAEQALTQGRKISYGLVHFFESSQNNLTLEEINLARELSHAFDNQQMELYYQPKASLVTGQIFSSEALIRWNHPQHGVIAPDKFIPLAERYGLIHRLGHWVLEEACEQLNRWKKTTFSNFKIAVNMSLQQLMDVRFLDSLKQVLKKYNIVKGLEIELTESVLLSQEKNGLRILEEIAGMGIQLNIDDFGTGYSNLSYLRKMPVKFLKIDRSFITEIIDNTSDQMIVRSIIAIGHNLGMQVIAEGVETQQHCAWLKSNQCDFIQGYLLTRPLPIERFEEWIGNQQI